MQSKTVLITGASGFLGTHICRALLEVNYSVSAAVRKTSDQQRLRWYTRDRGKLDIEYYDLLQKESIEQLFARVKPHIVIHSAAYGVRHTEQNMETAVKTNNLATLQLFNCAADQGAEHFIHIGTSYEYGDNPMPLTESSPFQPTGVYGTTKAAQCLLLKEQATTKAIKLTIVRPFTMFGPLEGSHKLLNLIANACINQIPLELSAGTQMRNYIYIADVIKAITNIARTKNRLPAEINLYGEANLSIREFGALIAQAANASAEVLQWGKLPPRDKGITSNIAPTDPCAYVECTPILEAIQETLAITEKYLRHNQTQKG